MVFKQLVQRARQILSPKLMNVDQAVLDSHRTALLMKCFDWYKEAPDGTQPTQTDVDKFYREIEEMTADDWPSYNQEQLNNQMVDLFTNLDECHTVDEDIMEREEKERQGKVIKNGLFDPAKLVDTIGFTLEIANSSICTGSESGGGLGVFVKKVKDVKNTNNNDNDKGNNNNKQGVVPPGTVLALFPGKVHLAEFSSNGDYLQQELLPDNDLYLMVRADGQIVDGRSAKDCPQNPYALAHYVNHVPKGSKPNVLQYLYDFPADPFGWEEFPQNLRRYIPNVYAKKPTMLGTVDRSALMHGMVLVATRPLEAGEELVMDYRLSPLSDPEDLPEWYNHYDEEGKRVRAVGEEDE